MKKTITIILSTLFIISMTVGCGTTTISPAVSSKTDNSSQAASVTPTLDPVKLTWYVVGSPQGDQASVMVEANKIIKEKLNAELTLNIIDWGAFDDKMKLMSTSGEDYDLSFTSSWANNIFWHVDNGDYLELDGLIEKYCPTIWKNESQLWDKVKIKGKLYGVINGFSASREGLGLQKALVEKYAFDYKNAKTLADIEPFLAKIKAGEPGKIPLAMNKSGYLDGLTLYLGYDNFVGNFLPGAIKLGDKSLTVVNQYELPAFKEHCLLMRKWMGLGYMQSNAAIVADISTDEKAGKFASAIIGTLQPGVEAETRDSRFGGNEIVTVPISKTYMPSGLFISATAIPKVSKNPERALMLLELIVTNKQLSNILNIGIEGKHYAKIEEDAKTGIIGIDFISKSGYESAGIYWQLEDGNRVFFAPKGTPLDLNNQRIAFNDTAIPSDIAGFTFDGSTLQTEIANCQSVKDEFLAVLVTGSVDVEKKLPEFLEKLKKAGSEKIIAEAQKQLNAWKATAGK